MTIPLSQQQLLSLSWTTAINRLSSLSQIERTPLAQSRVESILNHRRLSTPESSTMLGYHSAINHLRFQWSGSNEPLHLSDLGEIYNFIFPSPKSSFSRMRPALQDLIRYTASQSSHPVIDACTAFIIVYSTQLTSTSIRSTSFPLLCTYLYLYRRGLDLYGLLDLESVFAQNFERFHQTLENFVSAHTTTHFLNYFATSIFEATDIVMANIIRARDTQLPRHPRVHLNQRQRQILALLENPSIALTNREVQRLFDISQITASRDLSQLATLGLVFAHGRSRSIHYTRT